jgi:hypothetical protein
MSKKATAAILIAAAMSTPAVAQDWTFKEIKDAMTDAKRGIATLATDQGLVVVKCDDEAPQDMYIHVITKKYLGGTNKFRQTLTRVDENQPSSDEWFYDTSSAMISKKDRVEDLTRQFGVAKKIAFRFTTYDGGTEDAVFTAGNGGHEAIAKAYASCGHSFGGQDAAGAAK